MTARPAGRAILAAGLCAAAATAAALLPSPAPPIARTLLAAGWTAILLWLWTHPRHPAPE